MPSVLLGLGIASLHHFIGRICLMGTPLWDVLLGAGVPLGMSLIALGAAGIGVLRLLFMRRVTARTAVLVHPRLQGRVNELTLQLHASPTRIFLYPSNKPLAFTSGVFRPTIVLSTWMLEHLDQRELEAVLVHELEHVARHDYFVIWLSLVLRDAFFYLPTCHIAYHQLQQEKELACDDLVVNVTQRPLALASALAKVWQNAVAEPPFATFGAVQPLIKDEEATHRRIERLLSLSSKKTSGASRVNTFSLKLLVAGIFLGVQSGNIIIVLAIMGCNPVALLEKLF
jgi:beta-lactamase regulating signal transducer with metallopeptidase domain